jgi:hypothetical protein
MAVGHASDDIGATGVTVVRGIDAPSGAPPERASSTRCRHATSSTASTRSSSLVDRRSGSTPRVA